MAFRGTSSVQSGFSLVEILIVVGLMGIVSMGMAAMIANTSKANRGMLYASEVNSVSSEIRTLLGTIPDCSGNFGPLRVGGPLDPNVATALPRVSSSSDPTLFYDTAVTYGNGTVNISSMTFGGPGSNPGPNPSMSPIQVNLRVQYAASGDVLGNKQSIRDIKVWVFTDAAGLVSQCSTGSLSPFVAESIGANGYVTFPNGLMMQWGRAVANPNATTTINFNVPFPNQAFSVVVSGTNDVGGNQQDNWPAVWRHSTNTTRFSFAVHSSNDSADGISWMAYGN